MAVSAEPGALAAEMIELDVEDPVGLQLARPIAAAAVAAAVAFGIAQASATAAEAAEMLLLQTARGAVQEVHEVAFAALGRHIDLGSPVAAFRRVLVRHTA